MSSIRYATTEDIDAIATVHVKSWQAAYQHIFPKSFLDTLSHEQRRRSWENAMHQPQEKAGIFVAENEAGEIIGFASCGINRQQEKYPDFTGELFAIYLLSSEWGKGIGEKLFYAVVEHLKKNQLYSMIIWALAENPACSFYEKLGGIVSGEDEITIDNNQYKEVAYGWETIVSPA
ncbi:L-amino acid N-acyltransferase YncA [Evansella caseinilytica]|uniref:L-amino acid N-acyltransferase YncA n=1 Tax=Evansella caseinilytica TaxID=1503961 RepID=A0A1H3GX55_9BACI|nr:GNAT family N-acetyltransferase [Evansella caseinilytica]SDY07565.1 L-amino acid N-acyltransferase YncA [Evansella caseinilytica]